MLTKLQDADAVQTIAVALYERYGAEGATVAARQVEFCNVPEIGSRWLAIANAVRALIDVGDTVANDRA